MEKTIQKLYDEINKEPIDINKINKLVSIINIKIQTCQIKNKDCKKEIDLICKMVKKHNPLLDKLSKYCNKKTDTQKMDNKLTPNNNKKTKLK